MKNGEVLAYFYFIFHFLFPYLSRNCKFFFQNSPASGDDSSLDFGAGNIPHFTDAQVIFSF